MDFSPVLTMDKIHPGWLEHRDFISFRMCTGEHDPPALHKLADIYTAMMTQVGFSDAKSQIMPGEDHFTLVDNLVDENAMITKTFKHFILTRADKKRKRAKL